MTTTPIAEVAGVSRARFPNQHWAAWGESFELVRNDLMLLGTKLVIHEAHLEAWNRATVNDGTGLVHRWMADNYADSMLMGLRRVIDGSRRSFSLIKLLEDIARGRSLFDSVVAHRESAERSAKTPAPNLSWADLNTLFRDVTVLFNKYYSLVNPGVHVDFMPVLPAGFNQAFARMLSRDVDG